MGAVDPPRVPGSFRTPGFWVAWLISGFAGAAFSALWSVQTHAAVDLSVTSWNFSAIGVSGNAGVLVGVILALGLADRYPKQRALRLNLFSMATCCVLAFLIGLSGVAPFAMLHVTFVTVGVLFGLNISLVTGLVSELVPRAQLAKAIVMLAWSGVIGILLGSPLATLALGKTLWDAPYGITFLYVAFLTVVAGLLTRRLPRYAGSVRFPGGFRDAASMLVVSRRLRALWVYSVVVGGCLAVFSSSVYVLAYFDLEGYAELSWLLIAYGGAGTLATLGLVFVIGGRRGWPVLVLSGLLAGAFCLAVAAAESFWPLLALMIPFGAASSAAALGANAIAMSHTRNGYFGRVAALLYVGGAVSGTGIAILGYAVGDWGYGRGMVIGAGIVLLIATLFLIRTWREVRTESSQIDGVPATPAFGLFAESAAPQKPAQSD